MSIDELLINNNIKYDSGALINNTFIEGFKFKENVKRTLKIRCTINKEKSILELLRKNDINLFSIFSNKYFSYYNTNIENINILFEYIVKSHKQIPETILKNFKDNCDLYYIDGNKKQIFKSSPSRYNRTLGFYNLYFEDFLNNEYESVIGNLISEIKPLVDNSTDSVIISNLYKKINKIVKMSWFRDPSFIENIKKESIVANIIPYRILIEGVGFELTKMNVNLLDNMKVVPLLNLSSSSFILPKTLFSPIILKEKYNCMVFPIIPKFAFLIVPNEYYNILENEFGNYFIIEISNSKDIDNINNHIFKYSIKNKNDVIGLKYTLEKLINN